MVCHREAHIETSEAGAPAFYTHGAKLILAQGEGAKLTPDSIAAVIDPIDEGVHYTHPQAISLTQASEYGLSYTPDEMTALGTFAGNRGLHLHIDGARFANAVVHSGASPADLTWRAGVDALMKLNLPKGVPVIRLDDAGMSVQMAEYVCHAVIRHFREFDGYEADMQSGTWSFRNPRSRAASSL